MRRSRLSRGPGLAVTAAGTAAPPMSLLPPTGSHIDVINIRGIHHTTAARLPTCDNLDIFAPHQAVWHYLGAIEPTVAAVLRLPPPHHPDAPTTTYPAPPTNNNP